MRVRNYLDQKNVRLVGPNCPGLLTPGEAKVRDHSRKYLHPWQIGVVSRSGTLTYEVLYALKLKGIGVSTCVGIGGDPINGTNFIDCLELFEHDPNTEKVILIGEIGGTDEEKAAEFISRHMTKPVIIHRRANSPSRKTDGSCGSDCRGRFRIGFR